MMTYQKPTGMQDLLPGTVEIWQTVEQKMRDLCRRFNYQEIRTPIFEQTELFERGVGEMTDIVEKEMYSFRDKGERSMTLRPENTAGVVRSYVENKLYGTPDLTKLYYLGPMFRYERPQAGRYRQFHQFGVEAFGSDDPSLDAEIITLGYQFMKDVGLSSVYVEINSIGNVASRATYRKRLLDFLIPIKETLCKDCQTRIERNPLRVLDCKIDQYKFTDAPSILDSLDDQCASHFKKVKQHLTAIGIDYKVNHRLVRGLDYYTHTAFEYKAQGIGAIDTIGGGGRYNSLVSQIGGPEEPGIGFAIGMERIILLLNSQGIAFNSQLPLDIYLVGVGKQVEDEVTKLLYVLRTIGIAAEKDYQGRKMKAQMKSADRMQARYAGIVGGEELSRGEITLKHLATGEQQFVKLGRLAEVIQQV